MSQRKKIPGIDIRGRIYKVDHFRSNHDKRNTKVYIEHPNSNFMMVQLWGEFHDEFEAEFVNSEGRLISFRDVYKAKTDWDNTPTYNYRDSSAYTWLGNSDLSNKPTISSNQDEFEDEDPGPDISSMKTITQPKQPKQPKQPTSNPPNEAKIVTFVVKVSAAYNYCIVGAELEVIPSPSDNVDILFTTISKKFEDLVATRARELGESMR